MLSLVDEVKPISLADALIQTAEHFNKYGQTEYARIHYRMAVEELCAQESKAIGFKARENLTRRYLRCLYLAEKL